MTNLAAIGDDLKVEVQNAERIHFVFACCFYHGRASPMGSATTLSDRTTVWDSFAFLRLGGRRKTKQQKGILKHKTLGQNLRYNFGDDYHPLKGFPGFIWGAVQGFDSQPYILSVSRRFNLE